MMERRGEGLETRAETWKWREYGRLRRREGNKRKSYSKTSAW